ncbi:Uncharacterized protein Fot_10561 [Forsythia ovata]|uniref:RNase H type-1 domain-containing protein n=1 Tax=Forsythia ovata TaxID=205694 RepID=A0ABD1WH64_9LAMI
MDALQHNEVDNSYFGLLIEESRLLSSDMPNVKFSCVRRSANQAAHTRAKVGSHMHLGIEVPSFCERHPEQARVLNLFPVLLPCEINVKLVAIEQGYKNMKIKHSK